MSHKRLSLLGSNWRPSSFALSAALFAKHAARQCWAEGAEQHQNKSAPDSLSHGTPVEQPSPEVCSRPPYILIFTVEWLLRATYRHCRAIKDIRGEVGFGIMT